MRTQAIVLKKIPIKEFDELIICYTRDVGKQAYQAKSILRSTSKQANHLDILTHVDFSLIEGRSLPIIVSAYSLNLYKDLRTSMPALSLAYFLLECFDKVVFEGEADEKLWDFMVTSLADINDNAREERFEWSVYARDLQLRFLEVMGYSDQVMLEELAHAQFRSLQFIQDVIH